MNETMTTVSVTLDAPDDSIAWQMRLREAHWNLLVELKGAGELEIRPHGEWTETVRSLGNGREILRFLIPVLQTDTYTVRLTLTGGGPVTIHQLRLDAPGLAPVFIEGDDLRTFRAGKGECDD